MSVSLGKIGVILISAGNGPSPSGRITAEVSVSVFPFTVIFTLSVFLSNPILLISFIRSISASKSSSVSSGNPRIK